MGSGWQWMARAWVSCGVAMSLGGVASAQSTDEAPAMLTYDTLLITTFQAQDVGLVPLAERLESALIEAMAPSHELIEMSEVPRFQSYDAQTYLRSCPPGEYGACALVVSRRTDVQWAVGAALVQGDAGTVAELVFVEPQAGREVVRLDVPVTEGEEVAFAEAVMKLYDEVIRGAYEDIDSRDREDPAVRAKVDQRRAALLAQSLEELEQRLGGIERRDTQAHQTKLTKEDLAAMEGREDGAPWTRAGLSKAAYLRWRRMDVPLGDFKDRRNGRFLQVLIRAGIGGGTGPFSERIDARYALNGDTLQRSELAQIMEVTKGGTLVPELELGFGVAPFLEVSAHFGTRSGTYTYRVEQFIEGQPYIPRPEISTAMGGSIFGARATFAPLMTYVVRPTATAGVSFWKGRSADQVVQLPPATEPTTKPNATYIDLYPGVEISAGKVVNVWARGLFAVPVVQGGTLQTWQIGSSTLPDRPVELGGRDSPMLGFQAGVLVRIGLRDLGGGSAKGPRARGGGPVQFDEEEEGL